MNYKITKQSLIIIETQIFTMETFQYIDHQRFILFNTLIISNKYLLLLLYLPHFIFKSHTTFCFFKSGHLAKIALLSSII